jgi:hypothetical protein
MAMTYAIKINNTDLTSYLRDKGYKVQRPKLWDNAERNMAGTLQANFIGIFPKITLKFRALSPTEIKTVSDLLDNATFTVSWWDEEYGNYRTGTFYAGGFDNTLINIDLELYEGFEVNIISVARL